MSSRKRLAGIRRCLKVVTIGTVVGVFLVALVMAVLGKFLPAVGVTWSWLEQRTDELVIARWYQIPGLRIQAEDWTALSYAVLEAHMVAGRPGRCGERYLVANSPQQHLLWVEDSDRFSVVNHRFVGEAVQKYSDCDYLAVDVERLRMGKVDLIVFLNHTVNVPEQNNLPWSFQWETKLSRYHYSCARRMGSWVCELEATETQTGTYPQWDWQYVPSEALN